MLKQAKLEERTKEIKEWYNGYKVGDTVLYNPWSIANCLKKKGKLIPYWVNTNDNQLIRDLLVKSSIHFKTYFELLLQGTTIEQFIEEDTVFTDLRLHGRVHESAIWNLLLLTGYLKAVAWRDTDQGYRHLLAIPNHEVRRLYRKIIEQWLSNGHGIEWYNEFLTHLLTGNMEVFEREFRQVMEEAVSVHDVSRDPESFYHSFMLGLTASLSRSEH